VIAKQRNTQAKRERENDKRQRAEQKRAKRAGKKADHLIARRPSISAFQPPPNEVILGED
jgi:hypothetical protein